MKIALITIHNANNYGAILQTFALQKILMQYGDVEIINYDNKHISIDFDLIRIKPTFHGLLGTGKDIFRLFPRHRVLKNFKQFIAQNMKLTKKMSTHEFLFGHAGSFDVYVAGSDQIWNPACISGNCSIDPVYFLDFAPKEAKKLSYASSMGSYRYSEEEKKRIKELLKDFDMVSVREKDGQTMLQEILERPVHHVVDPTLLLSKNEWLEVLGKNRKLKQEEKYILLYSVPKTKLIRSAVEYFSKKLGLKVIAIDQGLSTVGKVDKQIRDAGPIEYLSLFSNAEFVITDSFHGTCFSVNFQKPFVAIAPGKHSNRIESLLSLIGLQDRIVRREEEFANLNIEIDFEEANNKLDSLRKQALSLLSKAL
ncbi:MAG: hypothetical protein QG558_595 [Campylobacterota bacterium]|nr:hypothetical protein [Campylobacterota bacterium]